MENRSAAEQDGVWANLISMVVAYPFLGDVQLICGLETLISIWHEDRTA